MHDLSPSHLGAAFAPCLPAIRYRSGILGIAKEDGTKHAVRRRNSNRIGDGFGNRLETAGQNKRLFAFFKANAKDSETSERAQLIIEILTALGNLVRPLQRRAVLIAHAMSEHEREAKSTLEDHLLARSAIYGAK